MKLILSIIALTLSLGSFAQAGFTGTVKYAISLTGEQADQMAAFMPTSYTLTFGADKLRFDMVGGMTAAMLGHMIVQNGQVYMVKDDEETAYTFPSTEEDEEDISVIVKTKETQTILGHVCTKYTSTVTEDGTSVVTNMWVANDMKAPKALTSGQASGGLMNAKLDGVTLMMENEMMGMKMTVKASNIDTSKPDASKFTIPSNYEIKEFDAAGMFGGMGDEE